MAYDKQTWKTGQVITADKLNHIQDGITSANNGGGFPDNAIAGSVMVYDGTSWVPQDLAVRINVTKNQTDNSYYFDGFSWNDIRNFVLKGRPCFLFFDDSKIIEMIWIIFYNGEMEAEGSRYWINNSYFSTNPNNSTFENGIGIPDEPSIGGGQSDPIN